MIFLVFLLNAAISFWNAYACGANMVLAKKAGGLSKLLLYSGLTMSACGFTWCYLLLLSFIGMYTPDFIHVHGKDAAGAMLITKDLAVNIMSLGYAVIILPILGSGMAIWLESLVDAWKTRTFGAVARAGWNTFAQVNNIYGVVRDSPRVFSNIGKLFKGDNKNPMVLVVAIVILALVSGFLTTISVAKWSQKKHQ